MLLLRDRRADNKVTILRYTHIFFGIAVVTTPLINYGLGSMKNSLITPWKAMYVLPASLTMAWGLSVWYLLPADPISARGFNDRERYIAVSRLRSNNTGVRNKHIKKEHLKELVVDPKFWLACVIALLIFIVNGPVSTYAPTIIHGFGYSRLNSLLLNTLHGFWSKILIMTVSVVARKVPGSRCWMAAGVPLFSCLSCILLWKLPREQKGALLFATIPMGSAMAGQCLLIGLQLANNAGYTKRSGSSGGLFVGYCLGNFIGPLLFVEKDAPRYRPAFAVVTSTSAAASVLFLVYRYVCLYYNRKRDRAGTMENFDHAYDDDQTDMKVRRPPTSQLKCFAWLAGLLPCH